MDIMPPLQRAGCQGCMDPGGIFPFTMAFQPIVDIQHRRIDAYEALVRGPSGEGAYHVLSRVNDENRYAFDQACRTKAIDLATRLGIACRLNINFLPNAVYEPKACIRATLAAAARTGFPLDKLTFEFVESEEIQDQHHTLRIIDEYRRHGFMIALDDFGTGYSGLSRLAQLKPDIVKLDRELVRDCDRNKLRLAIVAAVVAMGKETGIKIVIEGVERVEEVEALRSIGAQFVQGFFYARPLFEGLVPECEIPW
ncbi:MAG: EAL domain-containing protein [Oxalobacteraceae bacterium]|nr:MAG: EAL domain-containing protein [Oxalobacteraceae bacterium]